MASRKGVVFFFKVLACLCFFSLSQGAGLSSFFLQILQVSMALSKAMFFWYFRFTSSVNKLQS
jgi:hypothetical protein